MNPTTDRLRVTVCVCTFRRPEVLDALLDRLKDVALDYAFVLRVLGLENVVPRK